MVKLVEASWRGEVEEDDGCAVGEAAGGDGARLCVFHRGVGAAGGHAGRFRRSGLLFECCRGGEQNQEERGKKGGEPIRMKRGVRVHLPAAGTGGSSTCKIWSARAFFSV